MLSSKKSVKKLLPRLGAFSEFRTIYLSHLKKIAKKAAQNLKNINLKFYLHLLYNRMVPQIQISFLVAFTKRN